MNDTINRYLAILCYPFASLDFFLEDYFEEIIQNKNAEKKLQEAMIRHIQENCNVYSYDEIYMYLEKCYLYDLRTKRYKNVFLMYLDCLYKITRSMISQRDGKIIFKYWENRQDESFLGGFGDSNKIFLFHSMNMHIPLDFIVMLYITQNPGNDINSLQYYYNQIEVADQQLDAVLKSGVAENHLHKGVSISFYEVWEVFMRPLDSKSINAIKSNTIEFGNRNQTPGESLFFVLIAGIVRIWLALALKKVTWKSEELNELVGRFADGKGLEEFYKKQWGGLKEKAAKDKALSYCKELWDDIVLPSLPKQSDERTIMQEIFHVPDVLHTSDELIFLFYGMKYLGEYRKRQESKTSENEKRIIQCFLQYIRIKNYVFGCTVQKKNVRGLDYFQKEYYEKDSKLSKFYGAVSGSLNHKKDKVAYWEQAMRKQFYNQNLKKIEFRASINDKEDGFQKDVKDFLEAYLNVIREDYCRKDNESYQVYRTFPRVGLVYHLLKKKDSTVPYKCFLDGMEEKEKLQFGVLEEKYVNQIRIMRSLRNRVSGLDRYIVGIDAASLENATPIWVFAKAYKEARDSSIEKVGYGTNRIQSLRFTFHAGEDFRHILSGLRRIDETVTYLKFHAGDRIGHGTALGILPEQWRRQNPFVVLPRSEALDNYVWAYYMLSQGTVECNSTLIAYLEGKVYELAKGIYGKEQNISLQVLIEGYLKMFDTEEGSYDKCAEAEDVGFCKEVRDDTCSDIFWNGEKIALARHCKKFLTEMECPIHYEVTKQDIQITEMLQKILCQKLSRKGIVVEVNPSSNVAIGEVDKITENQIYRLNRPGGEDIVMVCINSDDPMVFHTNVSNELAYIYYGMLYSGVSRETALEWIDKTRECGIKSSFLQREDKDQQIYDELEKIVGEL